MKKMVIKADEEMNLTFKGRGFKPEQVLHALSVCLVDSAIQFGYPKKELLDAVKKYYEEGIQKVNNNE